LVDVNLTHIHPKTEFELFDFEGELWVKGVVCVGGHWRIFVNEAGEVK
jgi:hypothetical protein